MKNRTPIIFKVLGLIALLLSLLFLNQISKSNEIDKYGIDSTGIVKSCTYVNIANNSAYIQSVPYYKIQFDYEVAKKKYSKILEIQPYEFRNKFAWRLQPGDEIPIRYSERNPKKVRIGKTSAKPENTSDKRKPTLLTN